MTKVLVLGSEGVVGSALCSFLESKEHVVTRWDIVLDPVGHDLRIRAPCMSNYDFVFFLAYDIGGSKYLEEQKLTFIDNNILIMRNTFNELQKAKVPFIFASSQMSNMDNPYGTLKKLGEQYTNIIGGLSVRFWNVYGSEEHGLKSHVITDFIHQYKTNKKIQLLTDGKEQRQFLHADDCAEALWYSMKQYYNITIVNEKNTLDITNFLWTSIIDLARIVVLALGPKDKTIIMDIKEGTKSDTIQTKHNEPDDFILLYWKPKIHLIDGIKQLAAVMSD